MDTSLNEMLYKVVMGAMGIVHGRARFSTKLKGLVVKMASHDLPSMKLATYKFSLQGYNNQF